MKLTKVHLIIILALALILCPILGVCSNMREGMVEGVEVEGVEGGGVDVTEGVEEGEDEDEGEDEGGYDGSNFAPG
jgi:hypothetical protein